MKNLMLLFVFTFAFGISHTNAQQVAAKKRIAEGVKSGELTKKETKQLTRQTRNLNKTKRVAKADGVVTKRERAVIHAKKNGLSKNISRQKNDRQNRYR